MLTTKIIFMAAEGSFVAAKIFPNGIRLEILLSVADVRLIIRVVKNVERSKTIRAFRILRKRFVSVARKSLHLTHLKVDWR
jgi:hypothetical protein